MRSFWIEDLVPDIVVNFLILHGAHRLPHSGRALLDHLVGTARIVSAWISKPDVVNAAVLHSHYSHLCPAHRRGALAPIVGNETDTLVWLFSHYDHRSAQALEDDFFTVPAKQFLRAFEIADEETVTREQLRILRTIDLANTLEQIPFVEMTASELHDELEFFSKHSSAMNLPEHAHEAVKQLRPLLQGAAAPTF